MSDTIKIRMTLSTPFVGSEVEEIEEIDREEWESMSEKDRDNLLDTLYTEFLSNNNYGGVSVEGDND